MRIREQRIATFRSASSKPSGDLIHNEPEPEGTARGSDRRRWLCERAQGLGKDTARSGKDGSLSDPLLRRGSGSRTPKKSPPRNRGNGDTANLA